MPNKFVRVSVDIELEKDVQDLAHKVASRAHTIEGVAKAFNERIGELDEDLDKVKVPDTVNDPTPTMWDRLKFKAKTYAVKVDSFFK